MRSQSQETALLAARRHALSDSLRLRIHGAMQLQPKTVKQIGEQLGVIPNRLYYHLRILEAAELIEVVGTTTTGRSAEKLYAPAGGNFGDELPGDDPSEQAVFFASIIEATKIEFTDNVLARGEAKADETSHPTFASLLRGALVCSDEERDEFWRAVNDLIERFNDRTMRRLAEAELLPPDVKANALTFALYEQPAPQ